LRPVLGLERGGAGKKARKLNPTARRGRRSLGGERPCFRVSGRRSGSATQPKKPGGRKKVGGGRKSPGTEALAREGRCQGGTMPPQNGISRAS